jgi:hypothetical protein
MRKLIEQCPGCGGDLVVTAMSCTYCETGITGRYQPSLFDRLEAADLRFVEAFVLKKGNVKEMERELGVSYWSIRNRLNDIVERLQDLVAPAAPESAPPAQPSATMSRARAEILDRLAAGELSPEEAAAQLATLPES